MKNKNVGYLIIGLAIVLGVIVFIFNNALTTIVNTTCTHGPSCSMYGTIKTQTYIGGALIGLIIFIGLFFVFAKEETKIITKTKRVEVEAKRNPIDYSKLDNEEKILIKNLEEAQGTIFQSDLVEKSGFDKVKVTRILDRLEGRQLIERKRRGMTNVVILK
ncbi:MAG: MarR family transcriptional regulator [Nanoarchaeota archaeon]|nr:MarR family transcriptional regulator [Nanoarchaeota archaeon]